MRRVIIFANGELPNVEKARALVNADDYIICADGGAHHALALGLQPNVIIGDLELDNECRTANGHCKNYSVLSR